MLPAVVSTAAELTPDWLTDTLRAAGVLPSGRVGHVTHERIGSGQLGATYLLGLTYDDDTGEAPARIVAKLPTTEDVSRKYAASLEAYSREVAFYENLAPGLAVRAPHCFHAAVAPDGEHFTLLLEDLTPAAECGQVEGCDPGRALRALEQAAALHGSSWHRHDLAGQDWLLTSHTPWRQIGAASAGAAPAYVERYGDLLDEATVRVARALEGGAGARFVDRALEPRCLWHSDFRLDNLLFDARGGDIPLVVVDWQSVALADGTIDASYFLGGGLPADVRREHEEDLVRGYHAALGEHGVTDYDWDACWDDYRRNAMAGFLIAMIVAMSTERSAQADAMFTTMAARHAAHIEDHSTIRLLEA